MKKSQARKLGFKKIKSVQQAYQILRRELKIYRSKCQSDPAAIISFEHLLKIQPGAWCMIPDRQVAIIEERFVHDDRMTEGQVEAILREIDSLDADDLGILTADQPAGGPSVEQLRKVADAEDAAGSVSAAGMAADLGMVKPAVCKGCGQPLKAENAWMEDGCPCNSPKGCNQPAGELREWWVLDFLDERNFDHAYRTPKQGFIPVREVPTPERVRAALDAWAVDAGWAGWTHCRMVNEESDLRTNKSYRRLLTLLRSLGVPTEGV